MPSAAAPGDWSQLNDLWKSNQPKLEAAGMTPRQVNAKIKLTSPQVPNPFAKLFGNLSGGAGATYPGGGYPGGAPPGGGPGGGPVNNWNVQTNPYQKEAYQAYRDLLDQINEWRKQVPDPEGALQNYRNLQAGTMSEIAKQGAQRGLGAGSGITTTQQLQAAREGREGAAKLSYDWLNRAQELGLAGLQALTGATGGMAGLGSSMAQMPLGWYSAMANAGNQREQNQIDWFKAVNQAQWQPLQFMGGLINALGGLF